MKLRFIAGFAAFVCLAINVSCADRKESSLIHEDLKKFDFGAGKFLGLRVTKSPAPVQASQPAESGTLPHGFYPINLGPASLWKYEIILTDPTSSKVLETIVIKEIDVVQPSARARFEILEASLQKNMVSFTYRNGNEICSKQITLGSNPKRDGSSSRPSN